MKRNDLKAKIEELGLEAKDELLNYIMDENGKDINETKGSTKSELDKLQEKFDSEKRSWEEEKSKYASYVSKDDHQKILDELQGFKNKEENSRRSNYLMESLKVKKGYEDLVSSKVDWTKASYDDAKKSYVGDEFVKQFEPLKEQYPDLFESNQKPIIQKGYYGPGKTVSDLTDL